MRFLIIAVAILLVGVSGASTVTLTGSCYSNTINATNSRMQFNITNSGNGTATDMVIEPEISGAQLAGNSTMLIPFVEPGMSYPQQIVLSNFSMPGSYVERFVVRYSQGSSTFTTIFPCIVNIGSRSVSLLAVTGVTRSGNRLVLNISSIADYPITANVSAFAPPDFNISQSMQNVTVRGYSLSNVSFAFVPPSITDAAFPISIIVSYARNGVHYSTLAITTITFGSKSSGNAGFSYIIIASIAVIAAIIALIIFSALRGRHKGHAPQHERASGKGAA